MRERQLIAVHAVMDHQEPARQPLFQLASAVGHGRIARLNEEGMSVVQQRTAKCGTLVDGLTEIRARDPLRVAGKLHENIVRRAVGFHEDGDACHALTADDPDFDNVLAGAIGDDRSEAMLGKIDVVDRPVLAL